ncbi:MAG: hypothetical protein JW922_09460 [Paludibacteraceae bacterium]|nr:hypothetical protein [Paludibacteraceae bacterium]
MSEKCIVYQDELENDANFCSNCGIKVKNRNTQLSNRKKMIIYLGSMVLAPFSLYWFFKYFRDENNKKVAYISLSITILAFVLSTIILTSYVQMLDRFMGKYKDSLNIYTELGY